MPQMMPINWMFSFFFFLMIFILFNILNYYIYPIPQQNKKMNNSLKLNNNLNWKW